MQRITREVFTTFAVEEQSVQITVILFLDENPCVTPAGGGGSPGSAGVVMSALPPRGRVVNGRWRGLGDSGMWVSLVGALSWPGTNGFAWGMNWFGSIAPNPWLLRSFALVTF
jgi:hypothetical protein